MFRSYSRFLQEPFTADASGIDRANVDLDHRRTVHTAFAAQSDVTVIWQGWIDLAARDVTDQEAVVQHLIDRRLRAPHGAPSPSSRQLART